MLNFVLLILSKSSTSSIEHFKNTIIDAKETVKIKKYSILSSVSLLIIVSLLGALNYFGWFVPSQANDLFGVQDYKYTTNKTYGNTLGDRNAKVIIHEYTDYQCPYCSISNTMLNQLVTEVNGVKIIHHDYPLDKACNFNMKSDGHKGSCNYAKYGLAAKLQGKQWDFNNAVFSNNQGLTDSKVLNYAQKAGLDIKMLIKDANTEEIRNEVIEEVKEANAYGITATPTYRIGIKKYEGLMPYNDLLMIVLSQGATLKR